MNTKIAFFDIDGTLVNVPNGMLHPTDETIRVLNEFKNQGNKIVIATARGEVPESVANIEFDGYICNDGHYIRFNNEILIDEQFDNEMVQKQLDVYAKYNGRSMFNGRGGASDVKAVSCCVLFDSAAQLWAAYHELEDEFTMIPYDTGLIRMDVYCKGFTKGTACEYLYQKLGIDYENTYAFGDGINDVEMLQLVKHGIAMGNAIPKLKSVASEITDSVDNDGIAQSFKKHFNI